MELIRRLRYSGYLNQSGITEHEPGEVFEKVIDHLASTHEWSNVSSVSGSNQPGSAKKKVSTGSGSDRVTSGKNAAKKNPKEKSAKKSRKAKSHQPEPDLIPTEPVKLHYLIDRRDFLEKVKSVYASYAA
jgi:hypothetical protein